MAQSTSSIASLNKLLAIRDQLSSRHVDAIKHHLVSNKPLPSTFFSTIEDLRTHRSSDLLTEEEHARMLNAHVESHIKTAQVPAPAESHGSGSQQSVGQKRKTAAPRTPARAAKGTHNIINAFTKGSGKPVSRKRSLWERCLLCGWCANDVLTWKRGESRQHHGLFENENLCSLFVRKISCCKW